MILTLIRFYKFSQEFYAPEFSQGYYSSDKIKKTQNEHLIIVCQNLIGSVVVSLKPISYLFGVYITWFLI